MKTLAWGSVPNNVRAWCAANMMANKAAMESDALVVVTMQAGRDNVLDSTNVGSLINTRVNASFSRATLLKPLWAMMIAGIQKEDDLLNLTLMFQAPGLTKTQVERICGHLSRLFKCVVAADRLQGNELEGKDFRVMFSGLVDDDSLFMCSRETLNLTLHQIHVEIAKENGAGELEKIEQVEMPFELSEEAQAELEKMEQMPSEPAPCVEPLIPPTVKDNWIVGWRLIGTAVKQFASETLTRLMLGKSYTH